MNRLSVAYASANVESAYDQRVAWAQSRASMYMGSGVRFADYSILLEDAPEFKDLWIVTVSTTRGEVFEYTAYPVNEETATRLAKRIRERGTIDPQYFDHVRTEYGSQAWFDNEVERQLIEIEREAEVSGNYRDYWKAM